MASFPYATGSHCRQVTIFPENVRFGNMWIITWISKVSRLPMASSTSPFTYEAVEVIFGSIYFYFHIQTAPNLQDCPHSDNLTTFPDFTLVLANVFSKALYNNTDVELLTFQHQTFRAVLSSKSTEQITIQMRNWIACYSNFKSFNEGIELQVFKLQIL